MNSIQTHAQKKIFSNQSFSLLFQVIILHQADTLMSFSHPGSFYVLKDTIKSSSEVQITFSTSEYNLSPYKTAATLAFLIGC